MTPTPQTHGATLPLIPQPRRTPPPFPVLYAMDTIQLLRSAARRFTRRYPPRPYSPPVPPPSSYQSSLHSSPMEAPNNDT